MRCQILHNNFLDLTYAKTEIGIKTLEILKSNQPIFI